MVLTAFWGPLGVIFDGLGEVLEALWALLGGSWELQVAPKLFFKALWDPPRGFYNALWGFVRS